MNRAKPLDTVAYPILRRAPRTFPPELKGYELLRLAMSKIETVKSAPPSWVVKRASLSPKSLETLRGAAIHATQTQHQHAGSDLADFRGGRGDHRRILSGSPYDPRVMRSSRQG
jgi:hypothetical protein